MATDIIPTSWAVIRLPKKGESDISVSTIEFSPPILYRGETPYTVRNATIDGFGRRESLKEAIKLAKRFNRQAAKALIGQRLVDEAKNAGRVIR